MRKEYDKMKLGKEIFKGIPQLEIIATTEGNEDTHTYYLSPFRAYGFQVSGNDEGQYSFGTSEFIGLQYIIRANEERIAKAIFRAMAGNALTAHNQYYRKNWEPSLEEGYIVENFINTSYDWVKSIVVKEDQVRGLFDNIQIEEKPGIFEQIKAKAWKMKQELFDDIQAEKEKQGIFEQIKSKVWKSKQA